MEELNKKLAEWAGFEYIPDWQYDMNMPSHWRRGKDWFLRADFTHSLDACFQWLVPKAYPQRISFDYTKAEIECEIKCFMKSFLGKDVTEAPALCKAIEKLIGENNDP